jgi:hypothetical protein
LPSNNPAANKKANKNELNQHIVENSDSEEEIDLDVQLDIEKLDADNRAILNKCAVAYGIDSFVEFNGLFGFCSPHSTQVQKNPSVLNAKK